MTRPKNYLDNPHIKELLKGGLSVTLEEEPTSGGAPEEEDTIIKVEVKDRSNNNQLHGGHPDNYSEYMKRTSGLNKEHVLTFKKRIIVHQSPLVKACLQQVQNMQNS